MEEPNLSGNFYSLFTADGFFYSVTDRTCTQETVQRLLSIETSASQPGMLLGKIQSGKTKTFLVVIALAFDNGFDIAVILTKGTRALARQTLERVRKDFARFTNQDQPLGPPYFSDSPDTAQREGAIARRVAIDMPMLIMIRQNGIEEQGWRGTPFYWPVIMAQENIPLSIFAHETTP